MTQNQKEWTINGALLAGIVAMVVLISIQKARESTIEVELPRAADSRETSSTRTASQAAGAIRLESTYGPRGASRPVTVSSSAYPNIGKLDIFRPLFTPPPETPAPTPTAAATPSLEKAIESWQLRYRRAGRGARPTMWVFKDKKQENVNIEVYEGKPFTVNDPAVGDFEITVKPGDSKTQVTLQYKEQEKTLSLK